MSPTLPVSLSPHICVVSSPDVEVALRSGALPPLPQLLQSFTPLGSGKETQSMYRIHRPMIANYVFALCVFLVQLRLEP